MISSTRASRPQRSRPAARTFLQVDLNNAYGELGVSPLASSEEIEDLLSSLRGKAMKRARAKSTTEFGEEEAEMIRIQELSEQIGTPEARQAYDRANPQNLLLVVQPSAGDEWLARHRRAGLITEWLRQRLGDDVFLPSPRCRQLWMPSGVYEELSEMLARFEMTATEGQPSEQGPTAPRPEAVEEPRTATIEDLDRITKEL